jgi:hypothetical protein
VPEISIATMTVICSTTSHCLLKCQNRNPNSIDRSRLILHTFGWNWDKVKNE